MGWKDDKTSSGVIFDLDKLKYKVELSHRNFSHCEVFGVGHWFLVFSLFDFFTIDSSVKNPNRKIQIEHFVHRDKCKMYLHCENALEIKKKNKLHRQKSYLTHDNTALGICKQS